MPAVRIAIAGAGLIGQRHVEEVDAHPDATLSGVVDPSPRAADIAARYSAPVYRSLAEMFDADKPDGVVLATPNTLHVAGGLECVRAGVPVIVEKPIGDSVADATRLVEAGASPTAPWAPSCCLTPRPRRARGNRPRRRTRPTTASTTRTPTTSRAPTAHCRSPPCG